MTRLAFIEFADEIDALAAALDAEGASLSDVRVVALEPAARLALGWRGVQADSTVPYLPNDAHERIIRRSEDLMRHIREGMGGFCDERGVTVAYATELCHHVRLLENHLLKVLEVVDAAVGAHPGATLYAAVGAGCTGQLLIGDTERYAGRLVRRYAEAHGISFVDIGGVAADSRPAADHARSPAPAERLFARLVTGAMRSRDVIMIPRASGYLAKLTRRLLARMPGVRMLGIDYEGPLDKAGAGTLLGLARGGVPPATLSVAWLGARASDADREALTKAVRGLFAEGFAGVFDHAGVDFRDLLAAKVESAWLPHLLRLLDDSAGLAELLRRLPRATMMSAVALGRMSVAGELAKVQGRRALFVSHGSHPAPVDPVHEIELLNLARGFMLSEYTHSALANPVQEAHLAHFRERHGLGGEGVPTGPLVFAGIDRARGLATRKRLGIPPGAFVATHAVTVKSRSGERFWLLETLDEFVQSVADLARAAERLPATWLVVRVHPGFVLSDAQLRSLLPATERLAVSSSGPFEDVLSATDLLVSYSSTAIDEALCSRIPVLLWDRWARYNHFGTRPFDGSGQDCWPVCYVDDAERLTEALEGMRDRLATDGPPTPADLSPYCYGDERFDALVRYFRDAFEQEARP